MTDPASFLPALKSRLVTASTNDFTELPQATERWLIDHIRLNTKDIVVRNCATALSILPNGDFQASFGQMRLNVSAATDNFSELEIALLAVGVDVDKSLLKTARKVVKLDTIGRIGSITLTCPYVLPLNMESTLNEIRSFCIAAYNVLEETLKLRVRSLTSDIAEQLYFTFRSYCLNEQTKSDLWFAGISENHGFRLVDSKLGEEVIVKIPQAFGRSKATLATQIIDTALPVEGLLMKHVFNTDLPIDVDINQADYGKNKSPYSEAMQALYKGTAFSIHPVFSDGNWAILALSSIKSRDEVWGIIQANRQEFESICRDSKNRVRLALKRIVEKSAGDWHANWGKFFGQAGSEFLKNMAGIN